MQRGGAPLLGNPPTAAPTGGSQLTSIPIVCKPGCDAPALNVFMNCSTLRWSLIGSPTLGQWGLTENVSASDAQVSNTTGDGLLFETGAVKSVNSRQIKRSEFSVFPSTAPALAGTATTTAPCPNAGIDTMNVANTTRLTARMC